MPTTQWLLFVTPKANKQIKSLPQKTALSILDAIDELTGADNPLASVQVSKFQKSKDLWRCRQGGYRIFFSLDTRPVTEGRIRYRGTLIVVEVEKRDEGTYR